MKALNRHTSAVDGVAPGTVGEFPDGNPSVKVLVAAGLLVPVAPPPAPPADPAPPPPADPAPPPPAKASRAAGKNAAEG